MIRPRIGVIKRLAKLMVVRGQRIELRQKLGDLGVRRLHEMINGLAVISSARQGKAAVIYMRVTYLGHVHTGSLNAKVPSPRVISG